MNKGRPLDPCAKFVSMYGSSETGLSGCLLARPDDPAIFGLDLVLALRVRLTPLLALELLETERMEARLWVL